MKTIQSIIQKAALIAVLFTTLLSNAQELATMPSLPSITPPSPTVAGLMHFEEVPVDKYTGQPDITIPLVSKNLGSGLTLSATLKYNTMGVRVNERSGWTGTGWSLDAGGVISRTVRGVPDEAKKPTLYDTHKIATGIYHLDVYWNYNSYSEAQRSEFRWNVNGTRLNRYDCEPDLYQFSVLGYTGRFIVDKVGSILVPKLLTKDNAVKVVLAPGDYDMNYNIIRFKVIDANGNSYLFDQKETITSTTSAVAVPYNSTEPIAPSMDHPITSYTSSWHLSEIRGALGQLLATFTYDDSTEAYDGVPSITINKVTNLSDVELHNPYNTSMIRPERSTATTAIVAETKKLAGIFFKDGTRLAFTVSAAHSHPETDGVYLTKVEYKKGTNTLIKEFDLNYDGINNGQRLFLVKVTENGTLGYDLKYNNKQLLPSFGDQENEDEWGYTRTFFKGHVPGHTYNEYNWQASYYGLLESISYPTGGKTTFGFEPHTYSFNGSTPITDFKANPRNYNYGTSSQRFHVNSSACRTYGFGNTNTCTLNPVNTFPGFYLTHEQIIYASYSDASEHDCGGAVGIPPIALYDIEFYNTDTNTGYKLPLANSEGLQKLLPEGHYIYKLKPTTYQSPGLDPEDPENPGNGPVQGIDLYIKIRLEFEEYFEAYKHLIGGGVRIANIMFYEGSELKRRVQYNYSEHGQEFPDQDGYIEGSDLSPYFLSSGAIDSRLDHIRKTYEFGEQKQLFYGGTGSIFFGATGVGYEVTTNEIGAELSKGNYVGYKSVRVSETDNGFTDYTYSSAREWPSPPTTFVYPFRPSMNLDYKRGLLFRTSVFRNDGKKISVNDNSYCYQEDVVAVTHTIGETSCSWKQFFDTYDDYANITGYFDRHPGCCLPGGVLNCGPSAPFSYVSDDLKAGWAKLTGSVKKEYFYNGSSTNMVETSDSFVYNDLNYQVKTQERLIKEGSVIQHYKTAYEYPVGDYDFGLFTSSENASITAMRNANIINSPVTVTYSKDSEQLQQVINTYRSDGLPASVRVSKGTGTPETRITYNSYDDSGNIQDVSMPGGAHTTYIWGYNKTLPIAKIENASFDKVYGAVFHPTGPPPYLDVFSEANLPAINALRDAPAFDKAMITTFVHNPGTGLVSLTDPKKDSLHFYYDTFQRLIASTDNLNNLVGINKYRYASEDAAGHNWVETTLFKEALPYDPLDDYTSVPDADKTVGITYLDGLGRPVQQIAKGQSGLGHDLITFMKYDMLGRQPFQYLPYVRQDNSTEFDTSAESNQALFYADTSGSLTGNPDFENTTNLGAETKYEASPMKRPIEQAAPGNAWASATEHTLKSEILSNDANEVRLYKVTANWNPTFEIYDATLSYSSYYPPGELYKSVVKDEDWRTGQPYPNEHTTAEFKNPEGRVVLKRRYKENETFDTYYVYDQYGNLSFVIPPKANITEVATSTDAINGLCYQYRYDRRNRLAEKKLPGRQWEYIVYDKLDRVALTGPAASPFLDGGTGWITNRYDALGRVVYTAWKSQAATRENRKSLQFDQDNSFLHEVEAEAHNINGILVPYSNNVKPQDGLHILTINYYDDYDETLALPLPTDIETQPIRNNVHGMATGSWVRALEGVNNTNGTSSFVLYDERSRPVSTYSKNYIGGHTQVNTLLDFTGKPEYTLTMHRRTNADDEIVLKDNFTYDAQERPVSHIHQIGTGTPELLSYNQYDELGQLIVKKTGGQDTTGNTFYQHIDYSYNIRGWLTKINNVNDLNDSSGMRDLFAYKINYNTVEHTMPNVTKHFNGNIAETYWISDNDDTQRMYGYAYDVLDRLTDAHYAKNTDTGTPVMIDSYYEHASYDKNGNIGTLQRNGEYDDDTDILQIDSLSYTYSEQNLNRLIRVDDDTDNPNGFNDANTNSNDYGYDDNGNMTSDLNKNITAITYNHLDLPTKVQFGTGDNYITYLYDATGNKLKKVVYKMADPVPDPPLPNAEATYYLDGFQYKKGILQFFPTSEGYVRNTFFDDTNHFNYVYNYTDHLGNIRLSFGFDDYDATVKILEENNYYPFGLKHMNYNMGKVDYDKLYPDGGISLVPRARLPYQYKYNGKELQTELGLQWYDYGARNYDAALGRWMNMDPLAETSRRFSPYAYALDNPVRFIDPDGMEADSTVDAEVEMGEKKIDGESAIEGDDWIKSQETGAYEWRNEVTSQSDTPEGYSYVGKEDVAIVQDLFNSGNSSVSDWDTGLISTEDFDNPYSASGAGFNNMSAKTTMSVNIAADVTTTYNSDGSIQSKQFNGVNISSSISGEVVAPYPGVEIKMVGFSMTLQGNEMSASVMNKQPELRRGGDVPTLTYSSHWNSTSIQNNSGKSFNLNFNFKGQYFNGTSGMSLIGAFGNTGIPNTTNLSTSIKFSH
ncbi:DUF6443 domain-containing protein [Flavobacterium pallidum]|uniref:DUF6443 domain-containing protein n=1 Tax=Flavobacterium pallidum TaxID=2172098 RepID=A0A2S1SGN5_9FLAO|nr:DUF6443 domain-containing protein [Flavobacterium pallidum]AWI25512.1 hypothetical protein HYN49_06155 [Flavobacterium pallidum]